MSRLPRSVGVPLVLAQTPRRGALVPLWSLAAENKIRGILVDEESPHEEIPPRPGRDLAAYCTTTPARRHGGHGWYISISVSVLPSVWIGIVHRLLHCRLSACYLHPIVSPTRANKFTQISKRHRRLTIPLIHHSGPGSGSRRARTHKEGPSPCIAHQVSVCHIIPRGADRQE